MQRLSRMDGLRGGLAVYVMAGHAMPFAVLPGWCETLFSHGAAAVDLFFALSGLVIINSLERFGYRFWPFMRARAWRLLPVYFLVLAFALLLLAWPPPVLLWLPGNAAAWQILEMRAPQPIIWHLIAHLCLLHGLLPQGLLPYAYISILGPAWSLSTEWQFYMLIALAMLFLKSRHRLEIFTILLLSLAAAYHSLAFLLPPGWQFSRAFLPDAAFYFAIGLASNIWLRGGGAGLLVFSVVISCVFGLMSEVPGKALIPLVWGLVLYVQSRPDFFLPGRILDHAVSQFLGAISYPLYLVNEPAQRLLAMLISPLTHGDAKLFTMIWLPAALATPVLAATALHYGLEKPLMKSGIFAQHSRKKDLGRFGTTPGPYS